LPSPAPAPRRDAGTGEGSRGLYDGYVTNIHITARCGLSAPATSAPLLRRLCRRRLRRPLTRAVARAPKNLGRAQDVNLDGPPPRELCLFPRLRELDLDGGKLQGPFPEWLSLCFPTLAELDMSYNRLSGASWWWWWGGPPLGADQPTRPRRF
jgi:hypothetical protein